MNLKKKSKPKRQTVEEKLDLAILQARFNIMEAKKPLAVENEERLLFALIQLRKEMKFR